ncbi:hypothetical protein DXX93_14535 [Thalassotalea euphylliae]|uniref:Uncharacterized protein n=1 Tax=Thalassotalea euphylliae TaxID=1655234 RepID=A0A3E0TUN5_9GAMM|nr:hypothetical protein [Thalassotalea euphylliae]REL27652.1 hypothetical protein DXX93_14535 [Thalassotalea euphylliae]
MNIKFMMAGVLGVATGIGLSTLPITDELLNNDEAKLVASVHTYAEQPDKDVNVERNVSTTQSLPDTGTNAHLQDVLADKDKEIARLQQALAKLTDKVQSPAQHHKSTHYQPQGLGEGEQLNVQTISFEQLMQSAEPPYAKMIGTLEPEAKVLFSNFHSNFADSIEVARDFELEMKIQDFVTLHALANDVEVASVICKNGICEAKGKELVSYSWQRLMNSMMQAPWSQFQSSYSTADKVEEQGEFFYTLMTY